MAHPCQPIMHAPYSALQVERVLAGLEPESEFPDRSLFQAQLLPMVEGTVSVTGGSTSDHAATDGTAPISQMDGSVDEARHSLTHDDSEL